MASNQVVGGSSPSGRAKVINGLERFRKIESSNKNKNIEVVISGWGATVGNVLSQVGLLIGRSLSTTAIINRKS